MEKAAAEWRCLEGADFEELMNHWAKRENIVFGGSYDESESQEWEYGLSTEERANAQQVLRIFLSQHGVDDELPAALTLLDALTLAAEPKWPLEGFFLTPAVLAAIARLIVKFTLGRNVQGSLSDKSLFLSLASLDLAIDQPADVTRAEFGILAALDGRVWLPSPVEWAQAVLRHLEALGEGCRLEVAVECSPEAADASPAQAADSSLAQASVKTWAAFITDNLATTPWLRPRTLALGACALGLVGAGVMGAEEFRPAEVPEAIWEESLLVNVEMKRSSARGARQSCLSTACSCPPSLSSARGLGLGASSSPAQSGCGEDAGAKGNPEVQKRTKVETLAEAACCTPDELREHANYAVAALQAALSGARQPAQAGGSP